MNATTQVRRTESQALTTAALQIAAPAQNLILVPLSQLRPSRRNVRKTAGASVDALAASIARVGLLQNLTVIFAADGEHYEVVAGGRRLAALKLLAKKRRIDRDWEVPCLLVRDASARTVSLTENVQREAMHPADQSEAFAALVAEGRPIEDIAADFAVTPLVVQRRLKLANVSPRLMADYRADAVRLDQLMALAATDDHASQDAAFYDAPQWQRSPSALRERLTEREIGASHPLARFVGLDAYEQAGGGIRRDLFAEGDAGVYLNDAALLETLVRQKLASMADTIRAEGWAWVDATPAMTYADLQAFQRAPKERRTPSKRDALRIEKLQEKMQAIGKAVDAAMEADDEDKAEALQEEGERLGQQLQALVDGLLDYAPNVRAAAGAIVTIDRNGEAVIHRGLPARSRGQGTAHAGKAAAGFRQRGGRSRERRRRREQRSAQGRNLRPAGPAPECPPHRRVANRSRTASAGGAGCACAWHGANRPAGSPLRARSAAGRAPDGARPSGRHGPGLAGIACRRGAARIAAGMGRQAARGLC